jgi:hypothetical protein
VIEKDCCATPPIAVASVPLTPEPLVRLMLVEIVMPVIVAPTGIENPNVEARRVSLAVGDEEPIASPAAFPIPGIPVWVQYPGFVQRTVWSPVFTILPALVEVST